jgi:hypothetical protein
MTRRHGLAVTIGSALILIGAPSLAFAQAPAVTARAGHCQIVVSGQITAPTRLVVRRGDKVVFNHNVSPSDLPKTIKVGEPIGTDADIRVGFGTSSAGVAIAEADGTVAGCAAVDENSPAFNATLYIGTSVDQFAADDLKRYLNPNESGDPRFHSTVGVDFEYRAIRRGGRSLWIVGETLHSAKSTDIDCDATPELEKCQDVLKGFTTNPQQKFLAILRNATSVEASAAARLHLKELNLASDAPAAWYVQAKLGFITVADSDADAAMLTTYSTGLLITNGPFEGSYLDVGFGRSDVYRDNPRRRVKFDGLLSFEVPKSPFRPYFQITVDADFKNGPDSIQSYFGVDFDPRTIFKW